MTRFSQLMVNSFASKKKSFCLRGLNSKFVIRNHFVYSYSMFVVFVGRCSVCRTAEVHRSYHISFHCQFPCWKKLTEIKESCFVYIDSVYLNGCAVPVHHCRATLTYFILRWMTIIPCFKKDKSLCMYFLNG